MRARTTAQIAVVLAMTATAATFAQNRNPNPNFHAELNKLNAWTQKNRDAQHMKVEDTDGDAPCSGAKVRLQRFAPGGSVVVSIPGKFPPGTLLLSERDAVTLSETTVSATSASTRLTAAANVLPGFARVYVMTPLGIEKGFCQGAFVESVYNLDLKSPDGVVVKIRPIEKIFTIDEQQMNARVKYQAEFYKPNETKPFETLNGEQSFNNLNEDKAYFEISFGDSLESPQAQIERLNAKMMDPKTTDADRSALMQQMMKVQMQMVEQMTKDPAALDKKVKDFGCGTMMLYPTGAPGAVDGQFVCGENYHGGYLKVAGTMAIVK